MSKKTHPLLITVVIIVLIGVFLGGVAIVVGLRTRNTALSLSFGKKIGVIPITGEILTSSDICSQIEDFKKDKTIKAIILRINSPGGAVGPTQEIYREIQKTLRFKKVIVSMGGIAASGGYYIASAANKIVASPATITGSIGVIMHFVRIDDLLSRIGVKFEVLKSGEFKDTGSPYRKLTSRDKELLNSLLAEIKRQFVTDVAKGRHLKIADVMKIADGRIILGSQAYKLGLVDALGNFQDAVDLAKKISGLKDNVKLVYPEKERLGWLDMFIKSAARSFVGYMKDMQKTTISFRCEGF
ncbi:MAG: signal peptide peptidase SppA [Deltaproteobacteria bacterium]|nr:signal peptide peptidase SppA [Deltaproteobacteria bacterium]